MRPKIKSYEYLCERLYDSDVPPSDELLISALSSPDESIRSEVLDFFIDHDISDGVYKFLSSINNEKSLICAGRMILLSKKLKIKFNYDVKLKSEDELIYLSVWEAFGMFKFANSEVHKSYIDHHQGSSNLRIRSLVKNLLAQYGT